MVGVLISVVLAIAVAFATLPRTPRDERRYVIAGFAAHLAGAVSLVVYHVYIYKGGDMLTYHALGTQLAKLVQHDTRYLDDVLRLLLRLETSLPVDDFFQGSSGSFCALMALFVLV